MDINTQHFTLKIYHDDFCNALAEVHVGYFTFGTGNNYSIGNDLIYASLFSYFSTTLVYNCS